jgi:hypothetical protein
MPYRDLSIDPAAWKTPPSAWWLLRETAVQHEADNVSPTREDGFFSELPWSIQMVALNHDTAGRNVGTRQFA